MLLCVMSSLAGRSLAEPLFQSYEVLLFLLLGNLINIVRTCDISRSSVLAHVPNERPTLIDIILRVYLLILHLVCLLYAISLNVYSRRKHTISLKLVYFFYQCNLLSESFIVFVF